MNLQNLIQKRIHISGMREVISMFDYFIVDAWGVLHNGHNAFSWSVETLAKLKLNNKKIIVLSNAPRRSQDIIKTLSQRGIPNDY